MFSDIHKAIDKIMSFAIIKIEYIGKIPLSVLSLSGVFLYKRFL